MYLGLHTIILRDVVYCGSHYKVALDKSHYTSAHTIYHNQFGDVLQN